MLSFPVYNRGLVYHKVSEKLELGLTTTTPTQFKTQMLALKRLGFMFSTIDKNNPEMHQIMITFDDGYSSIMDYAAPILDEVGGVATVFAITDYIGKKNSWDYFTKDKQVDHMSWGHLRQLKNLGWEIGSHGRSHKRMINLSIKSIQDELESSKKEIEDKVGAEVSTFCPPFNAWNSELLLLIEEAGYNKVAISYPLNGLPNWAGEFIPRQGVYLHDSMPLFLAKLFANPLAPIAVLQQQIINLVGNGKILENWLKHSRA